MVFPSRLVWTFQAALLAPSMLRSVSLVTMKAFVVKKELLGRIIGESEISQALLRIQAVAGVVSQLFFRLI